jgi:hypothetical protein
MRKVVISGLMGLRKGVRFAAHGLRILLQILLALLILLEEWGWRPLADALAFIARWRPLAALEGLIARLPPYLALVAFVLPSTLLLPLKFIALVLVSRGYYVTSVVLFLVAKGVATALVARLFMLTQPALMRIPWFARGYGIVMPWKEALTERVRNSAVWRAGRALKLRAKRSLTLAWLRWKPTVLPKIAAIRAALRGLLPGRGAPPR